jgi:hypothetical protein
MEKLEEAGVLKVKTIDGHLVVERKEQAEEVAAESAHSPEDAIPHLTDVLKQNIDLLAMGIPEKEIRALMNAAHRDFDPTRFGFQEFSELLNLAADKGLVRIEADATRRGLRYYPGDELPHAKHGAAAPASTAKPAETKLAEPSADEKDAAASQDSGTRTRRRKRSRRRRTDGSASEPAAADSEEHDATGDELEGSEESASSEEPAEGGESDETKAASKPAARRASKRSRRRSVRKPAAKDAPDSD